jgi:hypothetical protein
MKHLLTLLFVSLLAAPLLALDPARAPALRVGVIATTPDARNFDRAGDALPHYLVEELRSAGVDAHLLKKDLAELRDDLDRKNLVPNDTVVLEVAHVSAGGGPVAGVAVGTRGVVGEVSVVSAWLTVELRVYDPETLEQIDQWTFDGSSTSPALTGIGVGDRWGFISLWVPVFAGQPYHRAARAIARDAAGRVATAHPELRAGRHE